MSPGGRGRIKGTELVTNNKPDSKANRFMLSVCIIRITDMCIYVHVISEEYTEYILLCTKNKNAGKTS